LGPFSFLIKSARNATVFGLFGSRFSSFFLDMQWATVRLILCDPSFVMISASPPHSFSVVCHVFSFSCFDSRGQTITSPLPFFFFSASPPSPRGLFLSLLSHERSLLVSSIVPVLFFFSPNGLFLGQRSSSLDPASSSSPFFFPPLQSFLPFPPSRRQSGDPSLFHPHSEGSTFRVKTSFSPLS